MTKLEKVKDYYYSGLWTKEQVKDAVIKGWITQNEYEEIINKTI